MIRRFRSSRWVRVLVGGWLMPWVAAWVIQLVGMTIRVRLVDPEGVHQKKGRSPFIFSFWHSRLFLMPYYYCLFNRDRPFVALISPSRDGEIIAKIASRFGIASARGSSSKQGGIALHQMVKKLQKEGCDVGITPDGPRGPREKMQLGVFYLSQVTGYPVVPISCEYGKKWELKSWDRFQIPYPFTDCILTVHPPLFVNEGASLLELRKLSEEVEKQLQT